VSLRNPGPKSAGVECLTESHVDNDVSGHPEDIAFAGLAGVSVAEVLKRECRIAAE
jgi:hypothetical protein